MKNIVHKILLLLFSVFFAGTIVHGQVSSFKSLKVEIQAVQKQFVPDKRVALLNLIVDTLKSPVVIKGETNLLEGKRQILQLLKSKGIQFVDSIRVFPAASLGDKTWGLVTLSAANMRSEPEHASELVSQALMGTPLKLLDFYDGWYLVQSPDYYIGWMEGNGLAQFTPAEMDRWKKSNRSIFNHIAGNAFDSPQRKSSSMTDLVLGDLFEVVDEVKGFLKIMLPDGRTGFVRKSECLSWNEWTSKSPNDQSIIFVARQMLGVPYLWGGTSCKAVDCSGLTKTAYYSQGIILARDASQQAKYGEHPDFNELSNLQPGDLLFFGRSAQRVTHVAIHMGDGRFIHASGRVRINSIDPKAPDFNLSLRKNLVAVSRILTSLNTEGIVLVKDHPWY